MPLIMMYYYDPFLNIGIIEIVRFIHNVFLYHFIYGIYFEICLSEMNEINLNRKVLFHIITYELHNIGILQ